MNELINQVLDLSPAASFVIVFWLFGKALKKSPIADWMIPFVLGIVGAVSAPFVLSSGEVSYKLEITWVPLAFKGLCLVGVSVYAENIIKQWLSRSKTEDGGTQFLVKSDTTKPPTNP